MTLTIDDIDDLKELKKQTDCFALYLFDFISPLEQTELYRQLINLQMKIEDTLSALEATNNGD